MTQPAMESAFDRTKADFNSALNVTKADINSALDRTKAELRLEIQTVRASLMTVQWMTGAIVAGVLALVVKSFF